MSPSSCRGLDGTLGTLLTNSLISRPESTQGVPSTVIYFIGLLQHLEDLKLLYDRIDFQGKPMDDR